RLFPSTTLFRSIAGAEAEGVVRVGRILEAQPWRNDMAVLVVMVVTQACQDRERPCYVPFILYEDARQPCVRGLIDARGRCRTDGVIVVVNITEGKAGE